MNKKIIIPILFICLILVSFSLFRSIGAIQEDFTDGSWVEGDATNILTIVNDSWITLDGETRNAYAIVEKNFTQNFTDFEITCGKLITSDSAGACMPCCAVLRDYVPINKDLGYASNTMNDPSVWICHKDTDGGAIRILGWDEFGVFHCSASDPGPEQGTYTIGVPQWFRFYRNDTNVTCEIYSDPGLTSHIKTIRLYDFSACEYKYMIGISTYNDANPGKTANYSTFDYNIIKYGSEGNGNGGNGDEISQFVSIEGGNNGTANQDTTPTFNGTMPENTSTIWLQVSDSYTNWTDSHLVVNLSNISESEFPSHFTIINSTRWSFALPEIYAITSLKWYYCRFETYTLT